MSEDTIRKTQKSRDPAVISGVGLITLVVAALGLIAGILNAHWWTRLAAICGFFVTVLGFIRRPEEQPDNMFLYWLLYVNYVELFFYPRRRGLRIEARDPEIGGSLDETQRSSTRLSKEQPFTHASTGPVETRAAGAASVPHITSGNAELHNRHPFAGQDMDAWNESALPALDAPSLTEALMRASLSPVKVRRRTSAHQLAVLEDVFVTDKKPNSVMRRDLSDKLNMTPRDVQVWFQNRRAKEKKLATWHSTQSGSPSQSHSSWESHSTVFPPESDAKISTGVS